MLLPLTIQGKVIRGEQVGRTIGFPTANINTQIDEENLDAGVYIGECEIVGKKYYCLPYFGPRLIFSETQNVFEIYIYDFDDQIYDQNVRVTLLKFQRAPIQVDSLPKLKKLLESDKKAGLEFLKTYSPGK